MHKTGTNAFRLLCGVAVTQPREAEVQQVLTELFPHLRLEAYNALRELFPTQSAQ